MEQRAAQWCMDAMVNRTSAFGQYTGSGRSFTAKDELTPSILKRHFRGETTIGLHAIGTDQMSRWVCWDFDCHADDAALAEKNGQAAKEFFERLREAGAEPVLEDSDGRGSFHLWVVFDQPLPAWQARSWARSLAPEGVEVFPKQDRVREGGYGNYVRLPGRHHKRDHSSRFWDGQRWWDWPDGLETLIDSERCPITLVPEAPAPPGPAPEGLEGMAELVAQDMAVALACLRHLGAEYFDDYDRWIRIGMALHSVSRSDWMLAEWDAWSRTSAKYQPGLCREKWASFRNDHEGVGLGTLVMWAFGSDGYFPGPAADGGDGIVARVGATSPPAANSVECVNSVVGGAWEDPLPLRPDLPDLPAFPLEVLPEPLKSFARALADQAQVPVEMVAGFCLAATSLAICRRFRVEPWEGWQEETNLWVAATAASGTRKSTVASVTTRPVFDLEREFREELEPLIARANTEKRVAKRSLEAAEKEASREPENRLLQARAGELAVLHESVHVPARPRLVTTNITNEGLSALLGDNDGRLLVATSEGAEILSIAGGLYTQGKDNFDTLLKGWSGDAIAIDRKSSDPVYVRNPTISMALMFQPAVLQELSAHRSFRGRGLLARFLFIMARTFVGHRVARGRPMEESVRRRYHDMIGNLLRLPDALNERGELEPRTLRFSVDAAQQLESFFVDLEKGQEDFGPLESLRDWASKAHGQVARLAAVFHMAEHHAGAAPWSRAIDERVAAAAIELGRYFLEHAKAAFLQMGEDQNMARALKLADYLRKQQVDRTTKRDLHRALPLVFERAADLDRPLEVLAERGHIRFAAPGQVGGPGRRPSPIIMVNPKCLRQNRHIRQNSPEQVEEPLSVESVNSVEEGSNPIGQPQQPPESPPHGTVRF